MQAAAEVWFGVQRGAEAAGQRVCPENSRPLACKRLFFRSIPPDDQ